MIGKISKIIGHKYSFLLLLIPLIFIVYPLLSSGFVMFGDFPLIETSFNSEKYLSTWIDNGSHHGFETLSRFPFITLGYLLNSINVGADIISKFLVVLGFFAASFSFYFACILFFKSKVNNPVALYRVAAIIGSLFYAYNVWSFHRIHHWYLWLGYAILPLYLVLLFYSFKNPKKWKYIIATVLIWTVVSSTPHMAVFYGLIFLSISIFFIVRNVRNRKALIKVGIPIFSILFFFLLINVYWIYPYVLYSQYSGTTLLPSILVTEELTGILSRDSNFLNVLRLVEDWWQPRIVSVSPAQTTLLYPFWLFASFVFPILAFSTLLLKKNCKYVLLFSSMGIIGILLTLGTNAPFNFYSIFLFQAPLFPTLQYLFRDPDKWAFMIALAYSFLISIFSFEFLNKVKKLKYKSIIVSCFLSLIFLSFILYSYPTYTSTSEKVLDPVILPAEYDRLNQYLRTSNAEKVFFMFQDYAPTTWNKGRQFYGFDQGFSAKPNIMAYQYLPVSENYHHYLVNSILSNKSSNINNFIFPLGTSYVIYSNDELNTNSSKILRDLSLLQEFRNVKNFGFLKIYKAGKNSNVGELNIPKQNIIIIGGLDLFTPLNSLPGFSSVNSSLSFFNQNFNNEQKYQSANSADSLVLTKNSDDLPLSLLDEKYVINTFDFTNHGDPSKMWSKDSAMSLLNGEFHQFTKNLGIESWDFDYGKGLVMTNAPEVRLSIPLNVEKQNEDIDTKGSNFDLFMRYLKNQKGGLIKVYLDNKLIKEVDTFDKLSNNFVWKKVDSINLTKGKHTLTLENVDGFNAVNIFALLPPGKMDNLTESARSLADKKRVMYLLEAETNFYNNKGQSSGSFHNLFDDNSTVDNNYINGTITKTFKGQFKVPTNSDLVSIQFSAKQNPNSDSFYSIKNLGLIPAHKTYTSDFEKERVPDRLTLSQFDWMNYQNDILSTSVETNRSIYGNNSLNVDVKQGNFSYWGTLSTDFIPINDNAFYNVTLDVAAKDVNKLHSKVFYYDSDKREIKWDYIFGGRDGTFKEKISNTIFPPTKTKYVKIQMWVSPNAKMHSSYLLDNVKLEEMRQFDWINYNNDTLSTSLETNRAIDGNKSLKVDVKQGNFSHWDIISTDFIPINDNAFYNVTLDVAAKDVNKLHSKVFYYDSDKNELKSEFTSDAKDGSFEQRYSKFLTPPSGTKYVKIQMWVSPNAKMHSSYLLDNVKLQEIITSGDTLKRNYTSFENMNPEVQNIIVENNNSNNSIISDDNDNSLGNGESTLRVELEKGNSTYQNKIVTKPFSANENQIYNYTMNLDAKNVHSLSAVASFKNSTDVVENSTAYGNNASNGQVLSLRPGSEIRTNLDIIKPSNYTIALRAKSCNTCTFLMVRMVAHNDDKNIDNSFKTEHISLKSKGNGLKWLYTNSTYLKQGKYDLEIYSDSQTDLDAVVIYQIANANATASSNTNNKGNNENLQDLFVPKESPATMASYKKINPTKYEVQISNASRPYMLAFAESYDPQWTAHTITSDNNNGGGNNNFKTRSVPLYSIINGFFINKTGDYTLTIEYQPQEWFVEAGKVSLIGLVTLIAILFIGTKMLRIRRVGAFFSSLMRKQDLDN